MDEIYRQYISNSVRTRQRVEHILTYKYENSYEMRYLISQSLSELWLSWCRFCREVLHLSCCGTKLRSGALVAPRSSDNSIKRIAYEFKEASKGNSIKPGKAISHHYQEPTWGDVTNILKAIPVINPSNLSTLSSGWGLPFMAAQHLQTTRNTIAHLMPDSLPQFRKILVSYSGSRIAHPSEIALWKNPSKNTLVIFSWLEDLETMASLVTK
jgi:hypothetical protein